MRECIRKFIFACLSTLPMFAYESACAQSFGHENFSEIDRGRYLTIASDCAACHDDPYHHQSFAGGRPIETPFGNMVGPNITPDRETGIGAWSDAEFEHALRDGVLPNGKRMYPAMPYPYYTKMSSADVHAIRAYLNTVPAVHHEVKSNQLPFPFSIRAMMRIWDALYFKPGEFKIDAAKSTVWNRGAYLVEGAGHCGACHTPKNWLGADESSRYLQGYAIQNWFAPNITNDDTHGLGAWSQNDIVEYLKNGHNRIAGATALMAEEIANASSKMNSSDLLAIATYLKDQKGETHKDQTRSVAQTQMTAGEAIYADVCSGCHKRDGSGVSHLIPNLAASSAVAARDPTTLVRVVIEGAKTVATKDEPTAPAMPSYGWQLNDAQIAAVTTYVRNSWGHSAKTVSERDVHKVRENISIASR